MSKLPLQKGNARQERRKKRDEQQPRRIMVRLQGGSNLKKREKGGF